MITQEKNTKGLKFYSQRVIGIATFIGGPMAAGYLIRENYRSLEDPENGKKALVIGIIATILLFVGIFSIPESIMNKVPNQILPAIYTGIIYLIVEKIHGTMLNQHKENGNEFYSGWKAVGIGVISLTILLTGIFGYTYLSTDNELYEKYDKEMAIFTANETETIRFYEDINSKSRISLIKELDSSIIPKWEENIEIIEKTNAYENLPYELEEQNKLLTEYSKLRLEAFRLLRKAIQEDTDKYANELDDLHGKIDEALEKLN
jgi:hypothetical protein